MIDLVLFDGLVLGWIGVAVVTFAVLFFVDAPYGRYVRRGWGATMPDWLGWMVMEAPAALVPVVYFAVGREITVTRLVFLGLWEAHYIHRAFIYPVGLRGTGKRMPISVVAMAFFFNLVNGSINGYHLFVFPNGYTSAWLGDPRFLVGLALFLAGFVVNRRADRVLRRLRTPGEAGYRIPRGGLYRWISCPNYFGEIVEWAGWAVATWSLPGLAFAVWTIANLVPRARAHHAWYRSHFAGYPPERKALVPKLW